MRLLTLPLDTYNMLRKKNIKPEYHYVLSNMIVAVFIVFDMIGNLLRKETSLPLLMVEIWGIVILLIISFWISKERFSKLYKILYIVVLSIIFTSLIFSPYDQDFTFFALGLVVSSIFLFNDRKFALRYLVIVEIVFFILAIISLMGWKTFSSSYATFLEVFLVIPIFSFFISYIITWYKKKETSLHQTIEEQNFLLREVHHRAKNNLQMIMGILEMEGFNVADPECRKVLVNQSNRLKTMSLLHDHLSEIHNLERIDMKAYIESIIEGLGRLCPYRIEARVDAFTAKLQIAVHIALFINEAISNAIKYAYDDTDSDGLIECFVDYDKQLHQCHVKIKDYGGKAVEFQKDSKSMGMLLIGDIADRFGVSGVEFRNTDGVEVSCSFYVN